MTGDRDPRPDDLAEAWREWMARPRPTRLPEHPWGEVTDRSPKWMAHHRRIDWARLAAIAVLVASALATVLVVGFVLVYFLTVA